MVIYEAIFFDEETSNYIKTLEKTTLEKTIDDLHCTFKFRPKKEELFSEIVGKEFEMMLVGYGCDGKNSGFEIKLPEELKDKYINMDTNKPGYLVTPHITVSFSKNSTPLHTKNLEFIPLEKPAKVIGKFGYFMSDGTISFEI